MTSTLFSAQTSQNQHTRQRIINAAAQLMQRHGYETMSLKQLGKYAQVSAGSIYHFFPEGKEHIAIEAVAHAGGEFVDFLKKALAGTGSPAQAVRHCAYALAEQLEQSNWLDGCPLTATGLETTGRVGRIQAAIENAFAQWANVVAQRLSAGGIPQSIADDLSVTIINCLEGAEVMAQLAQSKRALHLAGEHLAILIDSYSKLSEQGE